jgi:hypothetical protein
MGFLKRIWILFKKLWIFQEKQLLKKEGYFYIYNIILNKTFKIILILYLIIVYKIILRRRKTLLKKLL